MMFRNSPKFAVVPAIGTLLLLGAAPASAAATVYHVSDCQELETFTFCAYQHFTVNTAQTPTGKTIVQTQERGVYTWTFTDGTTAKAVSTGHQQLLFQPGEFIKYSYHITSSTRDQAGLTCVYDADYVFAGGDVRVEGDTFACS